MTRFRRSMVGALITGLAHLITSLPAGAVWDHAHGDSANTGFARVDTAPASKPQQTVQVGTLAPGAGPVIGPNGTVYVANMTGKVLAFHPDGTPAWNRILHIPDPYLASPVVGVDGSVYAASVRKEHDRDRSGHLNQVYTRYESTLRKFSGDGGVLWSVRLPAVPRDPPPSPSLAGWPLASAAPSIWRSGTTEVVVMPVVYNFPSSVELRLLAFATQSGTVLGNTVVSRKAAEITGGTELSASGALCFGGYLLGFLVAAGAALPCLIHYNEPLVCNAPCLSDIGWPMPAVAIAPDRRGGSPSVIVSDELSGDTVGYTFNPATGFAEAFRVHDPARRRTSPPTVLPDGHIVLGTRDSDADDHFWRGRLTFASPAAPPLPDIGPLSRIAAAPTRLADGRLAVVEFVGDMIVFPTAILNTGNTGTPVVSRIPLKGESIASAAASCTHLFVASGGAFTTYDARTLGQVAQVPWSTGGIASPVIGPIGHVYGVMHAPDHTDSLLVWPPPPRRLSDGLLGTACDREVVHP